MTDVYKLGHEQFYPEGLSKVYSYLTSRKGGSVVNFGLQAILMKSLYQNPPTQEMVDEFKEYHQLILGFPVRPELDVKLTKLVELGYWPLLVKSLPEGVKVPQFNCLATITNTHPDFAWLVGFFESMLLKVWNTCSVATNSRKYYKLVRHYANLTCDNLDHLPFAVHDFGYRGVSSEETAELSGMAHLLYFKGTDTIPAVWGATTYYDAKEFIGVSIPATEHSTMSTNILMVQKLLERGESYLGYSLESERFNSLKDDTRKFAEALVILEIITNKVPTGLVSIVSDTYDYWAVIKEILPLLKPEILAREGKVVVRPDSGNPVEVIAETVVELDAIFGSEENSLGYKVLNPKIGMIYGDGMFLARLEESLIKLSDLGYASSNLVVGVGGLLLQQHSRDDYGFAVKATYAEVNGESIEVYKDPATDKGKRSHKGLMRVIKGPTAYETLDQQEDDRETELETVFLDGVMTLTTWDEILNWSR